MNPGPQAPSPAATGPNTARRLLAALAVTGVAVLAAATFAVALLAAVIIGAVIGIAAESDAENITHAPTSIDEVPTAIVADEAHVVIDLSALSADDFDGRTEALAVDVDVDFGSVEVIVPDDVSVAVDAETDLGSTSVFDLVDDGFDNRVVVEGASSPDLDLTIDLGVGDIDVDRG